jgi:hypothetical protein
MSPEAMQYAHSMHAYAPMLNGAKGRNCYKTDPGMLNKSADLPSMFHVQSWLKIHFFRLLFVCVLPRIIRTGEQCDKEDASKDGMLLDAAFSPLVMAHRPPHHQDIHL